MGTPVLFLNGPCGVGKTTIADAISRLLEGRGIRHMDMDFDALCQIYPRPAGDPHGTGVGLAALKAMLPVYGTPCPPIIVPRVMEHSGAFAPFLATIPQAVPTYCTLTADLDTLRDRVAQRESGDGLDWHLKRTAELKTLLDGLDLPGLTIDTSGQTPQDIAASILDRTGWPNISH